MGNSAITGLWIAVAFLFIAAAVFGGMYYSQQTEMQKARQALRVTEAGVLAKELGNPHVAELFKRIQTNEDEIKELRAKLEDTTNQYNAADQEARDWKIQAERTAIELKETKEIVVQKQQTNQTLREKLETIANNVQEDADQRVRKYEIDLRNLQIRAEGLTGKNKRGAEMLETLRKAYHKRILDLERENRALREVMEKWQKTMRRDEAIQEEAYDGQIIQADVDNKFVVVNLGKAQKVHRGMRFDVIRWRLNQWDYMGSIELKQVGPTTSTAVILDSISHKKLCPLCGFVATKQEMTVCPFCREGTNRDRVVELIKSDVEEKPSMRKLDPIVVGDYISNPFYSKQREMRFVVAGESIHYSNREIKEAIRRYGAIVQDGVEVDTDYLVLGRIPEQTTVLEDEEASKTRAIAVKARDTAKLYGVPIMREVELFNFLRH